MTLPGQEPRPHVSAEVERAAQEQDLGMLLEAFSAYKKGHLTGKYRETGDRVYRFEAGLVNHPRGQAPAAFRFDQITIVVQFSLRVFSGGYQGTAFRYQMTRSDGAVSAFAGEYSEKGLGSRFINKENPRRAGDPRLPAFGQEVCEIVSRALLPGAVEALARGESLKFGNFVISTAGVQGANGVMPWPSIQSVEVKEGTLRICQEGHRRPQASVPTYAIPNLPLFLTLARSLQEGAPAASPRLMMQPTAEAPVDSSGEARGTASAD
jgi:hypothetical protein